MGKRRSWWLKEGSPGGVSAVVVAVQSGYGVVCPPGGRYAVLGDLGRLIGKSGGNRDRTVLVAASGN